ncbi:hypothetical protein RND71_038431 [Anisodus tanguticus]|uniref:FBD domain-containing protein n=1 Tax=Anisodus tanguticus TaxID=243964 RepID=A0AAE1QZP7_9SOLA|nr:hypothetical protein RND71_038431 [Anisodus tanguticus]
MKLDVEFGDLAQVSGVFQTMSGRSMDEVTRYLADPYCVEQQFEKLENVKLTWFEGTPSELIFLKLILAHSPVLSRVIVLPSNELNEGEILNFYEQLTMSLSVSPRVQLTLAQYDPVV